MKILIRNLSRSTAQSDIEALFAQHGKVQSCSLVMDDKTGESKGFGFVQMPRMNDAKEAIKKLNGTFLDGNKIRVKKTQVEKDKP